MKTRPYYCVKEIEFLTGRKRATIFRWRKSGYMPEAVEIGPNSIGWYIDVFDAWLLSRPSRVKRQLTQATQKRPMQASVATA
jgi:predicted DNA-binding transcriptional regulator AlpA